MPSSIDNRGVTLQGFPSFLLKVKTQIPKVLKLSEISDGVVGARVDAGMKALGFFRVSYSHSLIF